MNKKKDQFRPQFCSREFYETHQNTFQNWTKSFNHLDEKIQVILTIVGLLILRRPKDWYAGPTNSQTFVYDKNYVSQDDLAKSPLLQTMPVHLNSDHLTQVKSLFPADTNVLWPKKIPVDIALIDFLSGHKIKAVPLSVQRALLFWLTGDYPLVIKKHIPTPEELLHYQCEGQRIISIVNDPSLWPDFLMIDRDYLSFLLHDLIHADHFFHDNKAIQGQKGFYKSLQLILKDPDLQSLRQNPDFSAGFDYLMSDMNAHPIHLIQTLNALVKEHSETDKQALMTWNSWTNIWSTCISSSFSSLQKINTQLFSHKTAIEIDSVYGRLGQATSLGVHP